MDFLRVRYSFAIICVTDSAVRFGGREGSSRLCDSLGAREIWAVRGGCKAADGELVHVATASGRAATLCRVVDSLVACRPIRLGMFECVASAAPQRRKTASPMTRSKPSTAFDNTRTSSRGTTGVKPRHPVDVLTGEFAVFEETCPDPEWRRDRLDQYPLSVSVETVLASAAVPPLLPAVRIGDHRYWDGLFSHNPPIRDLVDRDLSMRPDEIWVIQIDPETCLQVPNSVLRTVDRRFELSSNLSLNAELHWVRQINQWVAEKVLPSADSN